MGYCACNRVQREVPNCNRKDQWMPKHMITRARIAERHLVMEATIPAGTVLLVLSPGFPNVIAGIDHGIAGKHSDRR